MTFHLFDRTDTDIENGEHRFKSDTFKLALTNSAPRSDMRKFSDLAEIDAGNGYAAGGADAVFQALNKVGDVTTLSLADVEITASGGQIGPFAYAVLYNASNGSKPLLCWWDGPTTTLNDGTTFQLAFGEGTGEVLRIVCDDSVTIH